MSVVKSKRTESKLEVLLVANQIAEYTIRICSKRKQPQARFKDRQILQRFMEGNRC